MKIISVLDLFQRKIQFFGSGFGGLLDPDLESGSGSRGLKKVKNVL